MERFQRGGSCHTEGKHFEESRHLMEGELFHGVPVEHDGRFCISTLHNPLLTE